MAKDLIDTHEARLPIDALLKHSIEGGQRFFQFKNGYCLSVVCNEFSYGVEAAVGKWRVRENSLLERFHDWWHRKKEERIEWNLVDIDLLKHPTWFQSVYAYLKPAELDEIKLLVASLLPWKEWESR